MSEGSLAQVVTAHLSQHVSPSPSPLPAVKPATDRWVTFKLPGILGIPRRTIVLPIYTWNPNDLVLIGVWVFFWRVKNHQIEDKQVPGTDMEIISSSIC